MLFTYILDVPKERGGAICMRIFWPGALITADACSCVLMFTELKLNLPIDLKVSPQGNDRLMPVKFKAHAALPFSIIACTRLTALKLLMRERLVVSGDSLMQFWNCAGGPWKSPRRCTRAETLKP